MEPDYGLSGPKAMAPELHWISGNMGYKDRVRDLILEYGLESVCEIGGGRSPLFNADDVAELGIDYTVFDISEEELALAPAEIRTVCADICDAGVAAGGARFDLMFSAMVAEHVRDGDAMHRNILSMLKPGGIAFHYIPTLLYPVFVANRFMPQRLSAWALRRFAHRPYPKFRARYSKCWGPNRLMRRYLASVGYEVVEYRPFYGTLYFESIPGAREIERAVARWAARRRSPWLTSFAYLIVRKPLPGVAAADS